MAKKKKNEEKYTITDCALKWHEKRMHFGLMRILFKTFITNESGYSITYISKVSTR